MICCLTSDGALHAAPFFCSNNKANGILIF